MGATDSIADIRRQYGDLTLSLDEADPEPIKQFEKWFAQTLDTETTDPTAMVLSTVDSKGYPDSRVVLLKQILDGSFIFFTHYQSTKAQALSQHPYAALNFYWPVLARQVRIRGCVKRVDPAISDRYFESRPYLSQLSAIASPQSQLINGWQEIETTIHRLMTETTTKKVVRPEYWGGYAVIPEEVEFWQGRNNRLHDRVRYFRKQDEWIKQQLAP